MMRIAVERDDLDTAQLAGQTAIGRQSRTVGPAIAPAFDRDRAAAQGDVDEAVGKSSVHCSPRWTERSTS